MGVEHESARSIPARNKSHWCGICAGNRGRGLQKFLNS